MAIEHDFFGLVETESDGSMYWSDRVEFGDQSVHVQLTAPDEQDVPMSNLDLAASLLNGLEDLDTYAREAMVTQLSDRTSEVTEYILQQQEQLGSQIEEFFTDYSGDIAIDVIKALQLINITILVDEQGGKDPFLVMEYALDAAADEQILLVNLAADASVLSVTSAV